MLGTACLEWLALGPYCYRGDELSLRKTAYRLGESCTVIVWKLHSAAASFLRYDYYLALLLRDDTSQLLPVGKLLAQDVRRILVPCLDGLPQTPQLSPAGRKITPTAYTCIPEPSSSAGRCRLMYKGDIS